MTVKEMSVALKISTKTVEFHKSCLMDELELRTTAELTRYALSHQVIAPDQNLMTKLAYRKWEEGGQKNGEADSDWFWAEHQAGVPFS